MNKKRKMRLAWIILLLLGVSLAVFLGLKAFNENLLYFYTPSDILAHKALENRSFRLGGMVVSGSVKRKGLTTYFDISDTVQKISVVYTGILPDLFREGQGVITTGSLKSNIFEASEVLAKHDENYMPPEVASSIARIKKNQTIKN